MNDAIVWLRATFDHGDVATFAGAILGATIAAAVAVTAYVGQQKEQRRQARAQLYAEALRSVEDYLEAPYRVRRRNGSAEARMRVTDHISDIQSRISYYDGLLQISASKAVTVAFENFVKAARCDAGPQMTAAWGSSRPRRTAKYPYA